MVRKPLLSKLDPRPERDPRSEPHVSVFLLLLLKMDPVSPPFLSPFPCFCSILVLIAFILELDSFDNSCFVTEFWLFTQLPDGVQLPYSQFLHWLFWSGH